MLFLNIKCIYLAFKYNHTTILFIYLILILIIIVVIMILNALNNITIIAYI